MKKFWCVLATVLLVLVCAVSAVACGKRESVTTSKSVTNDVKLATSTTSNPDGVTFSASKMYTVENKLYTVPRSYEAYFKLPASNVTTDQSIIGNWYNSSNVGINLMLRGGCPNMFFTYYDEESSAYKSANVVFNTNGNTNVSSGNGTLVFDVSSSKFINGSGKIQLVGDEWIHMVVTYDINEKRLNLYLNGTLIAHYANFAPEGNANNLITDIPVYKWKIGSDARKGNSKFCYGNIRMAATYSDVRSASEIASDYTRIANGTMIGTDTDGMLFGYDLTQGYPDLLTDKGPMSNDLLGSATTKPGYANRSNIVAGVTFEKGNALALPAGTINAQPLTVEAVFRMPSNYSSRGGTIFGNYGGTSSGNRMVTQMEVRKKGIPAIYLQNDAQSTGSSNFGFGSASSSETYLPRGTREMIQLGNDYEESRGKNSPGAKTGQIEVATGNWVHMVMIHDPDAKTLKLYLDGILVSQITGVESSKGNNYKFTPNGTYYIGGDGRETGDSVFKGELRSLAVYSDIRSEEEIFQDYLRKPGDEFASDANLMCAYDFTRTSTEFLKDMSGRGKNLIATSEFASQYASTDNDGDGYDGDGMMFHFDEFVTLNKALPAIPKTIEASILLPISYTDDGYVIFSNFPDTYLYNANYKESFHVTPAFMSFETTANGLRFYYVPADDTDGYREVYDIQVEADVKSGMWHEVAMVIDDEAKAIIFYVDGQEVGRNSASYVALTNDVLKKNFMIGGNYRENNQYYFRGSMRSLAVFSDARTASEIVLDTKGVSSSEPNLIAKYDLNVSDYGVIQDLSPSDVDVTYEYLWKTEGVSLDADDYAYSFAVIGDTQMLNCKFSTRHKDIYNWIVQNWENKKIEHVFGLGDITETNEAVEWVNAKAASDILAQNGKPYSLILGNHDNNTMFDRYYRDLDTTGYCEQFEGFYTYPNGVVNVTNSYKRFTVGETKYLLITMDYGMPTQVMEWAGELCDKYSDHRVIITTHSYVSRDGTLYSHGEYGDPNQRNETLNCGDEAWDKFVKNHGNIFLVLSGHDHWDNIETVQTEGIHGNVVTQMLIDPQSVDTYTDGSAIVAMLYFSADGSKMWVEYISTTRALLGEDNCYYKSINQFELQLDTDSSYQAHDKGKHIIAKAIKERGNCSALTEFYYSCSCGKIFEGESFYGEEIGNHRFINYEYNDDATCAKNGTETAKCEFCDKTKTRDKADSTLGHTFADEHACHNRNCLECGQNVPATAEHVWNGGSVIQEPTETSTGKKVYTCLDCGENKTEILEKIAEEQKGNDSDGSGEEKSGCSKESVALALATFVTLIACAFVVKK